MNIQISERAVERLQQISRGERPIVQLMYDNEGCGCAVTGVPMLALVEQIDAQYVQANVNDTRLALYYYPQHAVYFEDHLRIDYSPANNAFKLSSAQQIYTNDMKVRVNDKRTE
jgi:Fe-S cluster assembly iron-binding protein IscA